MTDVLQEIITILTGGISQLATGIGQGLADLVGSIFIETGADGNKLTVFGGVVIVFAGIALAIGLCRWVMSFVTSLGSFN